MQNTIHNVIVLMFIPLSSYMLRIDCWEAEKNLKTTPGSDCALNALAIDEPLEYATIISGWEYADVGRCGRLIRYFLIFKQIQQFKSLLTTIFPENSS